MSKGILVWPVLLLAACSEPEPLAPPFAGDWVSDKAGCGGPRIVIGKSGIAAAGMPIDGMTFTRSKVSANVAEVAMELSPAAKALYRSHASGARKGEPDLAEMEVLATLVASGPSIVPNNVLVRDKKTRQLSAVHPDILAILRLKRCPPRPA